MKSRMSYVLAGLFVVALGVALIAGVLWLTTGGPPKDYEIYRVIMTESVSGLSIDAPVKYKGVNRGRVKSIGLDPSNPEQVRIELLVLKGTPITADTVATLELQGLTGIATINLSGGKAGSAPLRAAPGEEYAEIPSRPSLLVRLDDTISELLRNLIDATGRISEVLDQRNQAQLARLLENAATLAGSLNERSEQIGTMLTDLDDTLRNVGKASRGLPGLVDQFQTTASSLEQMATSLADASESLDATGASLRQTVEASGRDLRRFTAGALPQADSLVTDLRLAAANLREMSETLRREPNALVFGASPPPPGPGEN